MRNHTFTRHFTFIATLLLCSIIMFGCIPADDQEEATDEEALPNEQAEELVEPEQAVGLVIPNDIVESQFPNAVFYEIFVMAFYDSTGDGIGDIQGMIQKLDYVQDLGAEGIWLMPVHPSPTYHKYDVLDYYDIDPEYGTMEDFKHFIDEAHARDIKVILDLVVNHTSVEHPWFQDAIQSKDSPYRDWYVWADEDTNVRERGEWGQPLWHGEGDNIYLGTFWGGMPDLNFDNPEVRQKMIDIGHFWLEEVGVDGFRLDAAKHIFKDNEQKNHEWWKEFRQAMEAVDEDVFLVGEVWAPRAVVAPYLDGLHSTFNFDLADDILNAAHTRRGTRLVRNLEQTRNYYADFTDDYVDSTFITNHDIDRVMSQFRGNENQARVAASLLLTLPGSPFIYYGEEIGMKGEKPDEHIREPMLWYENREGTGQTEWITVRNNMPIRHNIDDDAISVEAQLNDEQSLLNHYKTLVQTRRSSEVLINGNIERTGIDASGIASFYRVFNDEKLLVMHNLSNEPVLFELTGEDAQHTTPYFSNDAETKLEVNDERITILLAPFSSLILSE